MRTEFYAPTPTVRSNRTCKPCYVAHSGSMRCGFRHRAWGAFLRQYLKPYRPGKTRHLASIRVPTNLQNRLTGKTTTATRANNDEVPGLHRRSGESRPGKFGQSEPPLPQPDRGHS